MVFFSFFVFLASASLPSDIDDRTAWKQIADDEDIDTKTNNNGEKIKILSSKLTLEPAANYYITVTVFQKNNANAIYIINARNENCILISRCFFKEFTDTSVKADNTNLNIMIYKTCVYHIKNDQKYIQGGFAFCVCQKLFLNDTTILGCSINEGKSMTYYAPSETNKITYYSNNLNFTKNNAGRETTIHAQETKGYIQFSTFDSNTASSDMGIVFIYSSCFEISFCNFIKNMVVGKEEYIIICKEGKGYTVASDCYFTGNSPKISSGKVRIESIIRSPLTDLQHYMSYACYASVAVIKRTPQRTPQRSASPKPIPKPSASPKPHSHPTAPKPHPIPQPTASSQPKPHHKIEPDYTKMFIYTKKRNRMAGIS